MKGILRGRPARVVVVAAVVLVGAGTPVSADAGDAVGAGTIAGAFTYDAPGIPPTITTCNITTFDIGITSAVAVSAPEVYTGPLSFSGSGTSDDFFCDGTESGAGWVELSAFGVGPLGDVFSCPSLSGWFLRAYTLIEIYTDGFCELNGVATASMTVVMDGSWTPTSVTTSGNVMKAEIVGDITFDLLT